MFEKQLWKSGILSKDADHQWTCFYMIETSVMKELNASEES